MKVRFLIFVLIIAVTKLLYAQNDDYRQRLMAMKEKFNLITDYNCKFESFSANDDKSEKVKFNYFFKKQKQVRMEILTGKYEGTVLLYKGESVRLKLGSGLLSLFTFHFSPEHKYVCDVRGNGLHNSDWGYYIDQHINMLDLTESKFAGEENLDNRKIIRYELYSKDPQKSRSVAKEIIWIDKNENILVKYQQYNSSGNLIQSGYYKDIKINSGLRDTLFTDF